MINATSPEKLPPIDTGPTQRLHRSASDRVVFGVCGGIAEYLAVDPSLVRVAFIVATLWGGIGLLLYVALALILPVDAHATPVAAPYPLTAERSHMLAGAVLVILGGVLLASNLGFAPWLTWSLFWPSVLILAGLGVLLRQPRRGEV